MEVRARDRGEDGEVYNRFEASNNLQELVSTVSCNTSRTVDGIERRCIRASAAFRFGSKAGRLSKFHQQEWLSFNRSLLVSPLPHTVETASTNCILRLANNDFKECSSLLLLDDCYSFLQCMIKIGCRLYRATKQGTMRSSDGDTNIIRPIQLEINA